MGKSVVSKQTAAAETLLTGGEEQADPQFKYDGIPEEQAWFISHIFFTWMRPLFRRASYQKRHGTALQQEDLLPMPRIDYGAPILANFERCWEAAAPSEEETVSGTPKDGEDESKGDKKNTVRIRKAIFGVLGRRFIVAGVIKMLNTALQFSFPLILNAILKFIEQTQAGLLRDEDPWYEQYRGYWLSAVLFGVMASKAITENFYFFAVYRSGKFDQCCFWLNLPFVVSNVMCFGRLIFQDTKLE